MLPKCFEAISTLFVLEKACTKLCHSRFLSTYKVLSGLESKPVRYILTTKSRSILGDFLIFNLFAISLLYAAKVSKEKLVSNSLL